jgi:8-oxo-dGTP pyrophosphatase MutT (NUDIX family)
MIRQGGVSMASSSHPDENVDLERTRNPRRNVVVAGLLDHDSRILMVRTKRLPGRWQPIGGGVEPGDHDDLASALTREIEEEIGVELPASALHLVIKVPYDFGEGTIYFFCAQLDNRDPHLTVSHREILEHRWLPIDEALDLDVFPATETFLKTLARSSAH